MYLLYDRILSKKKPFVQNRQLEDTIIDEGINFVTKLRETR